jgi:hypothetical protein
VSPPIYYPPGIWGPTDPRPTHPIVLPPGASTPPEGLPPGAVWPPQAVVIWVPGQGYKVIPIAHPPEQPPGVDNTLPPVPPDPSAPTPAPVG